MFNLKHAIGQIGNEILFKLTNQMIEVQNYHDWSDFKLQASDWSDLNRH